LTIEQRQNKNYPTKVFAYKIIFYFKLGVASKIKNKIFLFDSKNASRQFYKIGNSKKYNHYFYLMGNAKNY